MQNTPTRQNIPGAQFPGASQWPVIKRGLWRECAFSTQISSAYDAIAIQTSPHKHSHTNILNLVACKTQKMKIWVSPPGRAFGLAEVLTKAEGNTRYNSKLWEHSYLMWHKSSCPGRNYTSSTHLPLLSFPRKRSPKQDELTLESILFKQCRGGLWGLAVLPRFSSGKRCSSPKIMTSHLWAGCRCPPGICVS